MPKKFILSGGGTGGHIFPAIAIADALKARLSDAEILFVGAERGMEVRLVQNAGYAIETVTISGLYRQFTVNNLIRNLKLPYKMWKSRRQATAILSRFRPDAAIGTGGFASFPLLRAAQGRSIFTAVQEQNAFPGLANRKLAQKANLVLLGNPDARKYFNAKDIRFTGNPIREQILHGNREAALDKYGLKPDKPTVLITGGSLGARTLNEAMLACIRSLIEAGVQVLWQCGRHYQEEMAERLGAYPTDHVWLMAFIDDMAAAYAAADLVVCRAGAITISELTALRKPAILVPSPNVAGDHQTANARSLSDRNSAALVADSEAVAQLGPRILELLGQPEKLAELQANLGRMEQPGGAAAIADAILSKMNA